MSLSRSVKIDTTGTYTVRRTPELATVHFNVHEEGDDAAAVLAKVKVACGELAEHIRKLAAPKAEASSAAVESEERDVDDQKLDADYPVTSWSINEIRTSHYTHYPDNHPPAPYGAARRAVPEEPKPTKVYTASAPARATFHDFAVLAATIDTLTANSTVSVGSINWDVTRATRTALKARVRKGAYADALTTAKDYSAAIAPNAEPRPVSVRAHNDGNVHERAVATRAMAFGAAPKSAADEPPSLEPEPISITSSVSVEFALDL